MTCYVMLSKLEKSKGKFNYFQYVLFRYSDDQDNIFTNFLMNSRYMRMIPATMGSVLLVFLWPLRTMILHGDF